MLASARRLVRRWAPVPDAPSENVQVRYGEQIAWQPDKPRLSIVRIVLAWIVAAAAVAVSVWIVPGAALDQTGAAFLVAAVIGVLNAVLPPILAAIRLPLMLVTGFLLVLVANAAVLMVAADVLPDDIHIGDFGDALLVSLLIAAVSMVLQILLGTNDDTEYNVRVTRRIARRQGAHAGTDVPGIIYLEIDGLALPVLRAAMRDGSRAEHGALDRRRRLPPRRVGDRPLLADRRQPGRASCSGRTRTSPRSAGSRRRTGACSCAPRPRTARRSSAVTRSGIGLLIDGGASRGNLLSGEAEDVILTVSRTEAERRANPGYRAFLANGFNVTRALVLFLWEIGLEVTASTAGEAPRRAAARVTAAASIR